MSLAFSLNPSANSQIRSTTSFSGIKSFAEFLTLFGSVNLSALG